VLLISCWNIVCFGQRALNSGSDLALIQLDFSAAFDIVNHKSLLYKLQDSGVDGVFFEVLENFLAGRTRRVKCDGMRSSVYSSG